MGAQVCVYKDGQVAASICCGTLGKVDPRPVKADTLFNCFSVTKGIVATALHMMMERDGREDLSYGGSVGEIWPEFACNGKEKTTLKHLLCHQSGLQHALPTTLGLTELGDFNHCVKHMETCKPVWPPTDERSAYHYFTFGWLAGEVIRRLDQSQRETGEPQRGVETIIAEEIAEKLGIADEFMIGIASGSGEGLAAAGRLATLSSSMVAGRNAANKAEIEELIKGVEEEAQKTSDDGEVKGGVMPKLKSEVAAVSALVSSLAGREYLADPRIFNDMKLREAVVPAANGHFSAQALAKFYACLANGGELDGVRLLSRERIEAAVAEWASEGGADSLFGHGSTTKWGLGYHLYPFTPDAGECEGGEMPRASVDEFDVDDHGNDEEAVVVNSEEAMPDEHHGPTDEKEPAAGPAADNDEAAATTPTKSPAVSTGGGSGGAFGHSGIGGSVALCDPTHGLSVAITVNHLVSNRAVAKVRFPIAFLLIYG